MEMNKMIGMIISVTVSIIIFVSVLAPTVTSAESSEYVDGTTATLIGVCGTLAIIAILMMVVRALGNKE